MSGPPRVLLKSLGCRLNEAEVESWARELRALGYESSRDAGDADLVVVNTCAVTGEAARKSRQLIRQCRRAQPDARVVETGCLASLPGDCQRSGPLRVADVSVPNRDKDRLVEIALETLGLPRPAPAGAADPAAPLLERGRQRAFVKVQDGCRHRCTFCVTALARGPERSRPVDEVVAEVRRIAESGIREAVLTGVHLGGYGSDLGTDLATLIRALLDETDLPRLRLGSVEPWDLGNAFFDLLSHPRLMPHLHLPMQSGSDAVLRRMARRCKTADFLRLAERLRAAAPGILLGTDIVAGFPGETQDDWQRTLDLVESAGFAQVHGFGFSPRPGTRAATMPDRPSPTEIANRLEELRGLAEGLRRAALRAQVGETVEVLRESDPSSAPPGWMTGLAPNYLPVRIAPDARAGPVGEIFKVRLVGVSDGGETLLGILDCPDNPD